jgi:hypothetical protein
MSGFSTPLSESDHDPTSSDQPMKKSIPYHHLHHKNRRNGNHAFRSLQNKRERHNYGSTSTTKIDCGWIC